MATRRRRKKKRRFELCKWWRISTRHTTPPGAEKRLRGDAAGWCDDAAPCARLPGAKEEYWNFLLRRKTTIRKQLIIIMHVSSERIDKCFSHSLKLYSSSQWPAVKVRRGPVNKIHTHTHTHTQKFCYSLKVTRLGDVRQVHLLFLLLNNKIKANGNTTFTLLCDFDR